MSDTGFGVNQSAKSGGDAFGGAAAGAGSMGGDGYGRGQAAVFNVDPIGTGIGEGGDSAAAAGATGAAGGDVSDNTSIGDININS